jgi:hypothetical protein
MAFVFRFGAVSGVLCGLFIGVPGAIEAFTGETAATSFVLGVSPALAPPLLVAIHLGQYRVAGRLGAVGYAVNLVGLVLFGGAAFTLNMVLFYLDQPVLAELLRGPTRFALLGAALVFVAGTVLFGLSMFRARVYPRAAAVGYCVFLTVFALAARLPDTPLTSGLHVLVAATLIWLAAAVWNQPVRTADPAAEGLLPHPTV